MDKREQDVLDQIRQKTADVKMPESLEPENIQGCWKKSSPGMRFAKARREDGALSRPGYLRRHVWLS